MALTEAMGKRGKERQIYLDVLRVAATCAVVLMHTVTGAPDNLEAEGLDLFRRISWMLVDLTEWCVPVFLIISGYLFLDPKREIRIRELAGKYMMRILLALFIFGVPFSLMEMIAGDVHSDHILIMVYHALANVIRGKSWAHLWYLYLILFLYAITPVIKRMLNRLPTALYIFVMAVLLVVCSLIPFIWRLMYLEVPSRYPEYGIYLFYYLCGYGFAKYARREKADNAGSGIVLLSLGAVLMIFLIEMISRLTGNYAVRMAYGYPGALLVAVLLFWSTIAAQRCVKVSGGKSVEVWAMLSRLCFGIYLIHPVFLNFAYKFMGLTLMKIGFWIAVPTLFAGALLGAALVTAVLLKIPFFRNYVL